MAKNRLIAILPGDGIGPEVTEQAVRVIECINATHDTGFEIKTEPVGGAAYDIHGTPLPEGTLDLAKSADAILLGAVGGPKWEAIERQHRPERALLGLRSELQLFSNLRPATLFPELAAASTLKPEVVSGLDIMIVRELTGGIYFGGPRGIEGDAGSRKGFNTLVYTEPEIERIAHSAFKIAMQRDKRLCSVDKANVLEVSELWREVVTTVGKSYPEVELSHMYVDNACMQLVRAPKQFDVIVTTNMFGDIVSDAASMLTGSIGMLPSASLGIAGTPGLFEPVHGSAPDIAGQGVANPCAAILSLEMALRWSLGKPKQADQLYKAVSAALEAGARTRDLGGTLSTTDMADAIIAQL